jgi:3-phosphoshikimate 1-carboxyvinyltransferase
MLDPLPIVPFTRPVRGEVALPGSKSITNRALLLAALCDRPVTITNALFSEDTAIMAAAFNALGIEVTLDAGAKAMLVHGRSGKIPAQSARLSVGNAGTAARFLTALCAAAPDGTYQLDGVPQMRKRPMNGLIAALRGLGADIRCLAEERFFPFEIHAHGLRGGTVSIDASESSQLLSALLMAAPLANAPITIRVPGRIVSEPFVSMTWEMMQGFGIDRDLMRRNADRDFLLSPTKYSRTSGKFEVEVDATAASYFAVLPIVVGERSELRIHDLITSDLALQGDFQFIKLLADHYLLRNVNWGFAPKPLAAGELRRGFEANFSAISDTFLTLAALAPLLDGPTRITGIGHTRKQETDRVAGAARELRKLGQEVVEEADALTIVPRPLTPDVEIETYDDHRFAMSFAILGCHDLWRDGSPWLRIRHPGCCAKTFPDFFAVLEQLRQKSSAPP